jgi:hypothetical protein
MHDRNGCTLATEAVQGAVSVGSFQVRLRMGDLEGGIKRKEWNLQGMLIHPELYWK